MEREKKKKKVENACDITFQTRTESGEGGRWKKRGMGLQGRQNGEKREEMRERERKGEGETVTLSLLHLWAYHLACRGKITVPVPEGPE